MHYDIKIDDLADMYRFKPHTVRSAFKAIQNAPSLMAALVFPRGIELLSVQTEDNGLQEQQFQQLLKDFQAHIAGVYRNSVRFEDFVDDVAAVKKELLVDDFDETAD